jgi:two-component system response regulator MtrA
VTRQWLYGYGALQRLAGELSITAEGCSVTGRHPRARWNGGVARLVVPVDENVLLIEDDPSIREIVKLGLERSGFVVEAQRDGRQGLICFRQGSFEAVVLDLMLPSLDGLEVCREIRKDSSVVIVVLTAKTETQDIVAGLELGADDYVTKPFELPELIARVRAVMRRASLSFDEEEILTVADLEIDPRAFRVTRNGKDLPLTPTEFRVLLELLRHRGQALTREILLDRVWGYEYLGESRVVDMTIKRLRGKIERDPASPQLIHTVRGIGYRLEKR